MDQIGAASSGAMEQVPLDLGEFIRGAMHEIANPLNAIVMNAELAKMLLERDQPARASEVVTRLIADCARCARLIQGMQRFGSGLHAYERQPVDARTLIEAAIAQMKQERTQALPEFHIDAVAACVLADSPALEHAIAGLLHNAAEAQATVVHISIRCDGNQVRIEIRDNGNGIAPDLHSRVVEPFFSTRRAEGASGLGLPLARELMRAHGGDLAIGESSERGACVQLHVPEWCGATAA